MNRRAQIIPKGNFLLLFELGYLAGECRNRERFFHVLRRLYAVAPIQMSSFSMGSVLVEAVRSLSGRKANNNPIIRFRQNNGIGGTDGLPRRGEFLPRRMPKSLRRYRYGLSNLDDGHFVFGFKDSKTASGSDYLLKAIVPILHEALVRCAGIKNSEAENRGITLSEREEEVLKFLKEGKTNCQIAIILGLSERTIKFHVRNLMWKLDAVNRYHLVAKSFHMLSPEPPTIPREAGKECFQ